MNDKKPTYKKEIIEVADIIFTNPDKKMSEIMRVFAEKFGKSTKTVERWISKAKEYNLERQQKQEQIKDEVLAEQTKEAFKKGILSRNEALVILSYIAKGNARKAGGEIIVPTDSERTKAITQLAKMEGWELPTKHEIIADPIISINVIDSNIPLASNEDDIQD